MAPKLARVCVRLALLSFISVSLLFSSSNIDIMERNNTGVGEERIVGIELDLGSNRLQQEAETVNFRSTMRHFFFLFFVVVAGRRSVIIVYMQNHRVRSLSVRELRGFIAKIRKKDQLNQVQSSPGSSKLNSKSF